MKIALMSDTHLMHKRYKIDVPPADIVIHCGDATFKGELDELASFAEWFGKLPYDRKIFVAGNHDMVFQNNRTLAISMLGKVTYLEDNLVEIGGVTIYGSPWQPAFGDLAFNLPRGHRLREKWNKIPSRVDVLVTHGPPLRLRDMTADGEHVGCGDLYEVVTKRVKPRLHAFGHVHLSYGIVAQGPTLFVNAAMCGKDNKPSHGVIVVDVDPAKKGVLPEVISGPEEVPLQPTVPQAILDTPPLW